MRSGEDNWHTYVLNTRIFGLFKCHSEGQTSQRQTEGETSNNEPHSLWQVSLVFQSLKGYQFKEAHQKASVRAARLWISIHDLPNRKEKYLPLECKDVERSKREINPSMFERWLKISSPTYTVSKTYLIFPWLAFITPVSQTSFRERMWRKECVRGWDMGEGNEEMKQFGNPVLANTV